MKISWVVANQATIDPSINIDTLKNIGSFWGGWQTWRSCQTDNVICNVFSKADELVKRAFQSICNFYIPNEIFLKLDKPQGVKLYEGKFIHDVDNQEEIVCMHLAASVSDIVLLLGFDFGEQAELPDKLAEHRAHNYRSLTKQVIIDNANVQWVLVDHNRPLRKDLTNLENLGVDSIENILKFN